MFFVKFAASVVAVACIAVGIIVWAMPCKPGKGFLCAAPFFTVAALLLWWLFGPVFWASIRGFFAAVFSG